MRLFYNIYGAIAFGAALLNLLPAHAADGESETPSRRFFPLAPARAGIPSRAASPMVLTPEATGKETQADSASGEGAPPAGFMTIDRAKVSMGKRAPEAASPTKPAAPPATPPASAPPDPKQATPESEEIEGNTEKIDPVLVLYGDAPPAASSFAEAMRGVPSMTTVRTSRPVVTLDAVKSGS